MHLLDRRTLPEGARGPSATATAVLSARPRTPYREGHVLETDDFVEGTQLAFHTLVESMRKYDELENRTRSWRDPGSTTSTSWSGDSAGLLKVRAASVRDPW